MVARSGRHVTVHVGADSLELFGWPREEGLRESSFNMTRGGDEDIEGGSENF